MDASDIKWNDFKQAITGRDPVVLFHGYRCAEREIRARFADRIERRARGSLLMATSGRNACACTFAKPLRSSASPWRRREC